MNRSVFKSAFWFQRVCGALLVCVSGVPLIAQAQEDAVETISTAVRSVFEQSRGAIVQIEARDDCGVIKGTGFYIDPIGTLYTLAAIIENAEEISVLHNGKKLEAELLLSDPRSGIALLRTEPGAVFLRPAGENALKIASPVMLVGYPMDLDLSPGFGLVAGFDKRIGNLFFPTTHIRVNTPILRGQGGAPILNMLGEVVGIATSSVDGGATCYALPIEAAEKVRKDHARFGELRHGWVGVVVENAEISQEGSSAKVCEIDPRGPAKEADIQQGDTILRVGNFPITCREDVLDASFFLTAGEPTEIELIRNGEKMTLKAEPTLHPSSEKPPLQAGMDLLSP